MFLASFHVANAACRLSPSENNAIQKVDFYRANVDCLPLATDRVQTSNHLLGGGGSYYHIESGTASFAPRRHKNCCTSFCFYDDRRMRRFFSFFFFYFYVIFFATPSEEMMSCEGNSVLGPLKRNEKTSRMSSSSFRPTAVERLKRRVTEHFFAPTQALSAFFSLLMVSSCFCSEKTAPHSVDRESFNMLCLFFSRFA